MDAIRTNNPLDWDIRPGEVDKTHVEEDVKRAYEENFHFQQAFSTESGKKVLAWLELYTLESPTWWPGRPSDYGYFREGQNQLVRQIKAKIKQATNYMEQNK